MCILLVLCIFFNCMVVLFSWSGYNEINIHTYLQCSLQFTADSYLVKNWRTPNNKPVTKRVSWHGLHERQMRGQWREIGQCLWVIHCSIDHADSWMLTTSDSWRWEQGCSLVLSQPDLSERQEVVGLRQSVHESLVHWQEDLPTGRRLCLQLVRHPQLMTPRSRHSHQPPLKHYTVISSVGIDNKIHAMKLKIHCKYIHQPFTFIRMSK